MAFLPDIGAYLVANVTNTTLVLGTNLFLGRLPDQGTLGSLNASRH